MKGCKRVRVTQAALINLVLLLISCSGQRFEETSIHGVPVEVIYSRAVRGDVKAILSVAQQEIQRHLPNAYLNAFVYSSRCDALSSLQGKFNMQFVRVERTLLRHRYLTAFVSIDTNSGMMDIEYLDYTGLDLRTDGLTFETDEISFDEVARIAHNYISAFAESDCDITITRTKQAWVVRCGPIENFMQVFLIK